MDSTDIKIQEILETLKISDGVYRREAVEAAVALQEEITPYLMPLIEKAFEDDKLDRWFFGPETFTEALEHGKEQTLEKLREELGCHLSENPKARKKPRKRKRERWLKPPKRKIAAKLI